MALLLYVAAFLCFIYDQIITWKLYFLHLNLFWLSLEGRIIMAQLNKKLCIEPVKQDKNQGIKIKNNRSLCFHFDFLSGFPDVQMFRCARISKEVLDKTYIYVNHGIELNEGIKIMCFICHFNVYFLCNWRKCSQNGKNENLKILIYEANDISSFGEWNSE